jgi:C-terminal processing protease CtpA/Prc
MGEDTGLKLTVARYYTPKGRRIDGKGITPDRRW